MKIRDIIKILSNGIYLSVLGDKNREKRKKERKKWISGGKGGGEERQKEEKTKGERERDLENPWMGGKS